jgi:hypothetical protein
MAAVVAGRIYRKLREQNYFAESTARNTPVNPLASGK